jgi:hypothetical protein
MMSGTISRDIGRDLRRDVSLMQGAGAQETPDLTAVRRALDLLGAPADAQPAELTRVYRQQARRLHPDLSGDPEATERFRALNAAYRLALHAAVAADRLRRRTPVPDASEPPAGAPTPGDGVWVVAGPVRVQAATSPRSPKGTGGGRP